MIIYIRISGVYFETFMYACLKGCDDMKESEGPKQDLRSRGLCLVPISSTFPVASEATADFWTPTFSFGGALLR